MQSASRAPSPISYLADVPESFTKILSAEGMQFVASLQEKFGKRVDSLLKDRVARAARIQKGEKLDFLPETKSIREGNWQIRGIPSDLQDRRVEITGPVERKMIINALNSGAKCFMADFEDSLTPGWEQVVQGQLNLRDAIAGTISYTSPEGKEYKLNKDKLAVLIVRPRGWHLTERHIEVSGAPLRGAFMDFGLYFYHNHKALLAKNSGPYFYLPKLESHQEAALWNDIFQFAEQQFKQPTGTIKCTVLIETITAAFEMDEILHALKDYIVAQNAGRWDYIFSYIKKHCHDASFVCPDRGQVLMTQPFLRAYSQLLIKTCHKRGAMAMGGMSAFIPIKNDDAANEKALAAVRADKEREAGDGHDGTWVAHPGLIPVAMEVFDRIMPTPNQISKKLDDVQASAKDLLQVPTGTITEAGVRNNISVSLQYLASWLDGNGCVPIFNLMEDAATAEIARTQLWQWLHHSAKLDDGRVMSEALFEDIKAEELNKIRTQMGEINFNASRYDDATRLLEQLVLNENFAEFLTLSAYEKV